MSSARLDRAAPVGRVFAGAGLVDRRERAAPRRCPRARFHGRAAARRARGRRSRPGTMTVSNSRPLALWMVMISHAALGGVDVGQRVELGESVPRAGEVELARLFGARARRGRSRRPRGRRLVDARRGRRARATRPRRARAGVPRSRFCDAAAEDRAHARERAPGRRRDRRRRAHRSITSSHTVSRPVGAPARARGGRRASGRTTARAGRRARRCGRRGAGARA